MNNIAALLVAPTESYGVNGMKPAHLALLMQWEPNLPSAMLELCDGATLVASQPRLQRLRSSPQSPVWALWLDSLSGDEKKAATAWWIEQVLAKALPLDWHAPLSPESATTPFGFVLESAELDDLTAILDVCPNPNPAGQVAPSPSEGHACSVPTAAAAGRWDVVDILLQRGWSIDQKDTLGNTALTSVRTLDALSDCLKRNPNVWLQNEQGKDVWHTVGSWTRDAATTREAARTLLRNSIIKNPQNTNDPFVPLRVATQSLFSYIDQGQVGDTPVLLKKIIKLRTDLNQTQPLVSDAGVGLGTALSRRLIGLLNRWQERRYLQGVGRIISHVTKQVGPDWSGWVDWDTPGADGWTQRDHLALGVLMSSAEEKSDVMALSRFSAWTAHRLPVLSPDLPAQVSAALDDALTPMWSLAHMVGHVMDMRTADSVLNPLVRQPSPQACSVWASLVNKELSLQATVDQCGVLNNDAEELTEDRAKNMLHVMRGLQKNVQTDPGHPDASLWIEASGRIAASVLMSYHSFYNRKKNIGDASDLAVLFDAVGQLQSLGHMRAELRAWCDSVVVAQHTPAELGRVSNYLPTDATSLTVFDAIRCVAHRYDDDAKASYLASLEATMLNILAEPGANSSRRLKM